MKFAQLVIPLISCNKHDFSWEDRHSLLPIKGRCDPPISYEDGAGIWSLPDWSLPGREDPDTFRSLRKAWVQRILHLKLDKQLMVYFSQSEHSSPPFTDDVVQIFRKLLIEFFNQHGIQLDWTIRAHQPMHLLVLKAFSDLMHDRDDTLFSSLVNGVVTGFHTKIDMYANKRS